MDEMARILQNTIEGIGKMSMNDVLQFTPGTPSSMSSYPATIARK